MSDKNKIIRTDSIQNRIYTIRGVQVMLDSDLAEMYEVELKRLNEQVKRNINRFPEKFRFQLSKEEYEILRSQIATSKNDAPNLKSQNATSSEHGGRRYLPYVFTEQGVSMLSAVLRSDTAVQVSIRIMNAFVEMRKFITTNAGIFQRLDKVEQKQIETDHKFEQVFKALENKSIKPKQGIFYDGQIFDAYTFICDIIKEAKRSIIVIDNYVDETTLTLLSKRHNNTTATIYTRQTKQLALDIKKHNQQYPKITIKELSKVHDRFIIIDKETVYHFGASLKDLGKKWFAFSKMEMNAEEILAKLPALSGVEMEKGGGDE